MKDIRYYIFWISDFLRGSPVYKHFREVRGINKNEPLSEVTKSNRLSSILSYATANSPFYSCFNHQSIESFPVLKKKDFQDNMDSMFSRQYLNLKDRLKKMSTSGSSGIPFKIFQDSDKAARNKADLLYFYELGGYHPGDRIYSMRIWNDLNQRSSWTQLKENFRMFDTSEIDDSGARNFVKTMLADTNSKVLLSYASSFVSLMNHISPGEYRWNIKAIFTGAEELPADTRLKMIEVFKCPVISRYSNQENGILAQQPAAGGDFFCLNEASYYFEFLKTDSDAPASAGEEARIVVTDLFNKAVPMIRYDTGDIGRYQLQEDGRRVLTEISGRKLDFLKTTDGKTISPYAVTILMRELFNLNDNISQYQFIQETEFHFTLKIAYKKKDKPTIDENAMVEKLKVIFGKESIISIMTEFSIPMESSGKRKYIVSKLG
ncbi:hypothetical protein [Emticicia fluvialis]|uniref:hypothetical protein n=1 Tax=Emticicia fluvialis TaxID=2974474 RepID=UPI0021661951|nr:hypothetical protein [Emticicia fluvialis]